VKAWAKQLVAAYNAVDQKKEEWKKGVLTATTNDLAKLTAADPPALTGELLAADHVADLRADLKAARVKWVEDIIPKLGAGTDWAKLGELCAALGDESPTVKACRLECWVEGKLPAPGPAALAGATDGYSAYVTALTTDKPRLDADPRLDQLVPTGDAWPKWLNPYRAGKVHELLYQAAIGGRGDKPAEGLGDKPYPAATAGRAADYLAAAIRTADRTGVQVPAGRLADARYEYLLAWWSSPNRKPGEEAKAAADALAGELGNLNKSPTAQARFWLIRAEVRPEAAVECYAKVLDIARRETPPLDAGALFERVVKNLLDQTWINGVSTPTTRVSLARVCYQAGQEVRRKVAGWDDLPDLGGKVEETAAKLFDTANGLDPKPDYALWRSISTVLRQNGRVDPVAATLASANGTNPAGQLLTGLLAKRQVADVRDRAEQVARLKDADKAFRSAIDLAGPIPDRRDELVEAYKQAADTAILMANYDTRAKAEERKSLLADAERWSDKLLNMENGWLRAWDTKGCVLEDQAWLFKDDPRRFALTGGYAAADKAFTTALKHKGNRAEALMHRGRNQIKWAEDLYEDGARQVPVDTGKLKAARADLEDALKQLAARPRPDLQAECHYWRAKAAVVEWLAARPADKADLFDTAAREFEAAAGFAARPGGDRTGYRYTALFEWAKLCNDDGITAYNARDTGRCGEMADRIERILARPEAAEAMSAAVTGYHKANALNLRYFAAGKAGNFDAWLEDLDRLVTPAVDAPCPSQDVWLKVDLLVRRANALVQRANDLVQRANAGGLDPNRDISRAVEDGRRAVKEADDSAWVPPVSKVQALTALGRALDAAADRAEEKDSKRTRWTEAGDTYERAINLDPDPKVSWPVYLRLGRVRMKAADELDEKDVSGRASGYMLAVAALTEADAGERLPGAVRAIIKEDQKFLEEFRQKGKDDFVGKDGKGGMRSYLSSALANYPDDPSVDGWRLAQTEIDIWLNGAEKLSPDARETARQLTAKITAAGSGKQATPTALALGRLAVRVRKAVEP
jgi:tetratricopeptide (TPR) repeat protein